MEPILDSKTQLLVALGAAVAGKCQTCFAKLYDTAERLEVSDSEIRAVVAIASKVTEKSHQFMAAFIDETTKGTVAVPGNRAAAPSGCGCS
jgi:alkylhydroperoxidase/carboxymuconolactone decarboxylase family protein YurZ